MILENEADPLFDDVARLSSSLGFSLLDLAVRKKDNRVMVSAVLTGPEGFGIDDCARVHRVVMPRLEVVFDQKDVYLEVSSPGLERMLRHQREFEAFEGKPLKYLLQGQSEWDGGVLVSVSPDTLVFQQGDHRHEIARKDVVKAKLDLLGEGVKE